MKWRRVNYLLSMVVILFLFSVPIMGQEIENDRIDNVMEVDNSSSNGEVALTPVETAILGNLTVRLEDTSKLCSKENVRLAIVKVADVAQGEFVLKETYKTSEVNLNEIKNANELERAAKKLEKLTTSVNGYMITDKDGKASISDLSVGVYLVYAEDAAEYENIAPFLVSVPTYNNNKNRMEYGIEIQPKHTPLVELEETTIPQTGIDVKTLEYAIVSGGFFMAAVILMLFLGRKQGKTRNL